MDRRQMKGTSVTVVLFGAETYNREWVRHEIRRSYQLGKGTLAIDVHNCRASLEVLNKGDCGAFATEGLRKR